MSECYDAELCGEKHKTLDNKVDDHETWLKKHDDEISAIKQDNRENHTEIKNLIKKMDTFITVIMWGLGIFVTVSLFFIGILLKR
ncbi:hemolysin XhlA family protein [Clostridium sp. WILCCON 0269]|uniref:Hemolysin XhlA family protein n=1 Tax=Candidatus Clostridium eludens TaxID=3381663 RepID=A0ABW8SPC4_9CLOT